MNKMENKLPYPFSKAFEEGHSIDYKCAGGDHRYVKELGYEPEMASDCTYYAKGLGGFSLSSYGDWGTFYPKWAGDNEKEMFLDMFDKGIIKLWRITAYIKEFLPYTKDWLVYSYSYEEGYGWKTYNEGEGKWVECADPFVEKPFDETK